MTGSDQERARRERRSRLPLLIPLLVLSAVALVAVTYHVDYVAVGPGPVRSVDNLISVPADRAFPHKGAFLLASVSLRVVTVFEALRAWRDPDVDLVKTQRVIGAPPSKETRRQFDVQQHREMVFSREVSVDVALRRLGIPVPEPGQAPTPGVPPFDVRIDTGSTGGASGGLALTLGILDALTRGDLTGGHRVAVSGSIFITGAIGDVDGIAQKTAAARSAGAPYMLVAPRNYDEAVAHAGHGLEVLKAANLDQAIVALQTIGGQLGSLRQPQP